MAGFSVGSATVDIVPDARGFQSKLEAQLRNVQVKVQAVLDENGVRAKIDKAAAGATAKIKAEFDGQQVKDEVNKATKGATAKIKVEADTASVSKELVRIKNQIIKASRIEVEADTSGISKELVRVGNEIEHVTRGRRVNIDVDDAGLEVFQGKLDEATRDATAHINVVIEGETVSDEEMDRLSRDRQVTVEVDTDGAADAEAVLDAVARDRKVDIKADDSSLLKLGATAGASSGVISALIAAGAALGPTIVPAAAAAAAAVAGIGPAAISSVAGIGILVAGFKNIFGAVGETLKAQDAVGLASMKSADTQVSSANRVAAAQAGLRSAQASLANAQANAADAARRSAQGIIDAQQGIKDAQEQATKGVEQAVNRQVAAQRSLARAMQAVVDAQQNIRDAQASAAEGIQAAVNRQVTAERTLEGALLREEQAQRSLSAARRQARRDMEDLTNAVADGQLSQRQAALDVQTTYDALVAAQDSGSRLEREAAQLAYDRATQRQKELAQDQARLVDDQKTSQKNGVEGSPGVQSAKQQITDAKAAVVEARRAAVEAIKAISEARAAGARGIAEARRGLKDAQTAVDDAKRGAVEASEAIAEARRNGARAVEDAERRLADAELARTAQRRQSAFSIAQATDGVANAQRAVTEASIAAATATGASAAAVDRATQAYNKLTDEGRALHDFLIDEFIPGYERVRDLIQAPLASGALAGLKAMKPLVEPITRLAENLAIALGDVFKGTGEALGGSFWVQFFDMLADTAGDAVTKLSAGSGNILTGIAGIFQAFQPLGDQILDWFVDITQQFEDFGTGKTGGLQSFLDYVKEVGPGVADSLGSIIVAFGHLVRAAAPIGEIVLGVLADLAEKIASIKPETLTLIVGGLLALFTVVPALVAAAAGLTAIAGAIAFVSGGVGAVIIGVAGIAIAFGLAYTYITPFREAMQYLGEKVMEGVRAGIDIVTDAIRHNLPVLKQMGDDFKRFGEFAKKYIIPIIGVALKYVFVGLAFVIGLLITVFANLYRAARFMAIQVRDHVQFMGREVGRAIDGIKRVLRAIVDFITIDVPNGWDRGARAVGRVWDRLSQKLDAVWREHIRPLFRAIAGFITDDVPKAFSKGVDAIGEAWDKVKAKAKDPIKFIVNTVLEDGILAGFRKVSDLVGYEAGKNFHITKMATGGVLPGYTPGRDVHRFISPTGGVLDLSGGETILRPELTRLLGEDRVNKANQAASSGNAAAGLKYLGGFAKGGVVWPGNTRTLSRNYPGHSGVDIAAAYGTPMYSPTDGTVEYTGFGRGYGMAIFIRALNGLQMVLGHASRLMKNSGDSVKAGEEVGKVGATGNATGPHIHVEVAPNGRFALGSNRLATLRYLGGAKLQPGSKTGLGPSLAERVIDYAKGLKERFTGPLEKLKTLGDSPFAKAAAGVPKLLAGKLVDKIRGVQPTATAPNGPTTNYSTSSGFRGYTSEQMNNAAIIASVGSSMGKRAQTIGIATAIVESGLRNLKYGDRDSVGLFQQRAPWGSFAARTNPKVSAGMFFHGGRGGQRGLDDIPGWQSMGMGRAAQAVQISAFPGRYQQEMAKAMDILARLKPASGKAKPSLFDNGGWLQPGTTIVHNKTGKPEPILNPAQWKAFEAMAANAGKRRQDGPLVHVERIETADARGVAAEIESRWQLRETLYPSWG